MTTDTPRKPLHVRLPARADSVIGPEAPPGEAPKADPVLDPKTATQDPTRK
jgi:hypothetical protein